MSGRALGRPTLGRMTSADGETRAAQALAAAGIEHTITRHGRVRSLEEAAAARGVAPADIIKTLVVRRADDDYLFVLVLATARSHGPSCGGCSA